LNRSFDIPSVIPTPWSAAFSPLTITKSIFLLSIISFILLITANLPDLPTISPKKKLLKIGIAHSCQKINKVPTNKYDKKLDIIITEKYILR
jgi:hypothetical protein